MSRDFAALPRGVAAIRTKILDACATGDLEALRIPIDWNELRPLFEIGAKRPEPLDPIEILKRRSFDRKGHDILRALAAVLNQPYIIQKDGPFSTCIFPALAVLRPANPSPAEWRAIWSCMLFGDLGKATATGFPLIQTARFDLEGVWHSFLPIQ